ncbi:MAG TPA: protein kinase [Steroidobacteraceae bacterium]|nr:protein kinase [Steroidobacteraceae bacterium]
MKARLLIVDRDGRYREWLRHHLGVLAPDGKIQGFDVEGFLRVRESVTRADYDLVLLAAHFGESPEDPNAEGLEWLRQLRDLEVFPALVAIAEGGNELTAVRALQLGALDYLPKRLLTPERLRTAVRLALRRVELRVEEQPLPRESAAAERSLRDPIPGYTIRRTIGQSEKAMVYLAHSAALNADVALKVSKSERDEANERQFLARERAAITAIRHPGIVTLYDYGVHQAREYLAMEYFPRGDLKARLQRGMLESDALRYIEQIARALEVVHQAGVVHRDLKPPNVMLRESDEIVLIDFGLARSLLVTANSTRKGVLRGSPYYMSPEQALGDALDARTDIYSLGIICYELLTGRKPYTGNSAMDVLQQHVNSPLPKLPRPLEHLQPLLDGMLAKSRDERFASAAQVIEAVSGLRSLRSGAAASDAAAAV